MGAEAVVAYLSLVCYCLLAGLVNMLGKQQYGSHSGKLLVSGTDSSNKTQYRHVVFLLTLAFLCPFAYLSGDRVTHSTVGSPSVVIWPVLLQGLVWLVCIYEMLDACKPLRTNSDSSSLGSASFPHTTTRHFGNSPLLSRLLPTRPEDRHVRRINIIAIGVCIVVLTAAPFTGQSSAWLAYLLVAPLSLLVITYMLPVGFRAVWAREPSERATMAMLLLSLGFLMIGVATLATVSLSPGYGNVISNRGAELAMFATQLPLVCIVVAMSFARGRLPSDADDGSQQLSPSTSDNNAPTQGVDAPFE